MAKRASNLSKINSWWPWAWPLPDISFRIFENGLYKKLYASDFFQRCCWNPHVSIFRNIVVFLGGLGPGWWFGFLRSPCKRDCYLGLALGSQTTGPQTPKPNHLLFCWLCWDFFNRRFMGVWFHQGKCCQDSPSIQCQIDIQLYIYIYRTFKRTIIYMFWAAETSPATAIFAWGSTFWSVSYHQNIEWIPSEPSRTNLGVGHPLVRASIGPGFFSLIFCCIRHDFFRGVYVDCRIPVSTMEPQI